jgi:hypothetical protein
VDDPDDRDVYARLLEGGGDNVGRDKQAYAGRPVIVAHERSDIRNDTIGEIVVDLESAVS